MSKVRISILDINLAILLPEVFEQIAPPFQYILADNFPVFYDPS